MPILDPQTTALVLIDLQKGITGRALAPHSGPDIIKKSGELADRFRQAGALVVLVNVAFAADFKDALRQPVDKPNPLPPGGYPPDFSELVEGLKKPGDLCITKHQWGAFYGTELDLQLRRRGLQTIVLAGVATNIGVESTARASFSGCQRSSASRKAMYRPRAASSAVLRATAGPFRPDVRSNRKRGSSAAIASMMSSEPSVEPSSTRICSQSVNVCARTEAKVSGSHGAAL